MAGPISYVPTASGSFNVGSHLPHVHHVTKKSCLGGKTRYRVEMAVSDASDSTMFVGFDSEMNKLKSLPAAAVCQAMEWQNNITSTFQVKLSKFKLEVRSSRRSMIPKLHCLVSPATLELKQITWDDHASLLEKIVGYECANNNLGDDMPKATCVSCIYSRSYKLCATDQAIGSGDVH
ncbi:hypothetical protein Bca101_081365 [Brassica carinata]